MNKRMRQQWWIVVALLLLLIAVAVVQPVGVYHVLRLDDLLARQGVRVLPDELTDEDCAGGQVYRYREIVIVAGVPIGEVNTRSCTSGTAAIAKAKELLRTNWPNSENASNP